MKKCDSCGVENDDEEVCCRECGRNEFSASNATPPKVEPKGTKLEFTTLSSEDMQKDWVTLVTCGSLVEADMVVSRLRATGIETFVPDEFLMQTGWPLNTYGYVRVQISPKDYEAARDFLGGSDDERPA